MKDVVTFNFESQFFIELQEHLYFYYTIYL